MEKKIETCPICDKAITLVEAYDHDSLCKDCYWSDDKC